MSFVVTKIRVMSQEKPIIAIVDDDAPVCRSLKRLLRAAAMEAETFSSGKDFLDRMETVPSFHPDCVVLDVHMPGMGGLEVQKRLAGFAGRLPVIFITAHDEEKLRDQALEGGAIAFLHKPFDDKLFLKILEEALQKGAGKAL